VGGNPRKRLENLLESLSWCEAHALGSLDLDLLAGLWVDAGAGLAVDHLKRSKTNQLERLALFDIGFHAVDDCCNDFFGICLAGIFAEGFLDGFNELEFAAHGFNFGFLRVMCLCLVTAVIQRKTQPTCQLPFSNSFQKNNAMNNDPSDLKHPDHLDYFAKIVNEHLSRTPSVPEDAFVAPGAFLFGDVSIGTRASVWPCASLRGDIAPISIGEESNVQDNAVIHVGTNLGVKVGRRVTIGHSAIVHACTIGDESLIGMGAIILDGTVIGERCLIGAHATVLMNSVIPPGSMVVGSPGRIIRTLSEEEQSGLGMWADHYLVLAEAYKKRGFIHPNFNGVY